MDRRVAERAGVAGALVADERRPISQRRARASATFAPPVVCDDDFLGASTRGALSMPSRFLHHCGSVDRDGVRVHYDGYGSGDVTLMLPPAWAIIDSSLWRAQVATLPARYRLITFDPRGNGQTDRPRDPAA